LFLDLLGTVAATSGEDAQQELARTQEALDLARDWGDSDPVDARALARWFSDNLGLAYPIVGDVSEADALFSIIQSAGQHQLALIKFDFIARGAISLDLVFADAHLLYGPALNRAVALEKTRATYPRVVLDEAGAVAALRNLASWQGEAPRVVLESLAIDDGGVVFVNYLAVGLEYDDEQAPLSAEYLSAHKRFIERGLTMFDGDPHIHDKYRWLAAYHNWYVQTLCGVSSSDARNDLLVISARPMNVSFRLLGPERVE
jgi:hypothetical protein